MQNTVTNVTSALNFDDILSSNVQNNAQNSTKGKDFAKIFDSVAANNNKAAQQRQEKPAPITKDKPQAAREQSKEEPKEHPAVKNEDKQTPAPQTKETDKKTTNTFEENNIGNEVKKVEVSPEKNVDNDASLQDAINRLNQAIENALDGQLESKNVDELKAALEGIQTQIDNNELVVSDETQQMITQALDKLTSQDPKALEVKVLEEDLKQLSKDIQANAFKTQSQMKLQDNDNGRQALEVNINTNEEQAPAEIKDTKTTEKKEASKTETAVQVSQNVKETDNAQKSNKPDEKIDQQMLDEMDVKIESLSTDTQSTGSERQNYSGSTAQDEIIKLTIENNSQSETPVTFNFDNRVQNTQNVPKNMQIEAPKEINTNDVLNQIGSKFEQLKDGSSTKITMTLRPHDLGRVTIELTQSANGISTNIIAQNSQVKELLDKNIDILKQQLAQQGVNVNNVQVKTVEQNAQTGLNSNLNRDNNQEGNQRNFEGQKDQSNQNNSQKKFAYTSSNIIDNADFESSDSQTAQINTAGGKIKYNI